MDTFSCFKTVMINKYVSINQEPITTLPETDGEVEVVSARKRVIDPPNRIQRRAPDHNAKTNQKLYIQDIVRIGNRSKNLLGSHDHVSRRTHRSHFRIRKMV